MRSASADLIRRTAERCKVSLAGVFVAFEGEDYSSIARIAETGGLNPDDRWAERSEALCSAIALAADIGCPTIALHAGTIPSDPGSLLHRSLIARVREVADNAGGSSLRILLETGRESAGVLLRFLEEVARPNVAVNFDCGNFVVYGVDEPASAVTKLKGRIDLVHLKDAKRSAQPGVAFGAPAPLGAGDAQIPRVVSKLRATGYRGPLLIEGPIGEHSLEAIRHARDYLRTMLG